jgi:hypothetical protein
LQGPPPLLELDELLEEELDAVVLEDELDAVVLDDELAVVVVPDDELAAVVPDDEPDAEELALEDEVELWPVDVVLSPLPDDVAAGAPPAPPTPSPGASESVPVAQAATVPDTNTAATNAR